LVALATRPSSRRSEISYQNKITTVVLAVNVLSGSRILSVSFTSRDPALAAAAANLAMQLYLDHQRAESFADLNNAQNWL
jgi:polysaccharide biosynthesis transport protein